MLNFTPISNFKLFEDGSFAYKVLSRAKKMRVIPDVLYSYNIENPKSMCTKTSNTERLNAIFKIIKETCQDWRKLGIFEKYKYSYITHILTYASLVCPDVIRGDYTKELVESFELDILNEELLSNIPEQAQKLILKMTNQEKCYV